MRGGGCTFRCNQGHTVAPLHVSLPLTKYFLHKYTFLSTFRFMSNSFTNF